MGWDKTGTGTGIRIFRTKMGKDWEREVYNECMDFAHYRWIGNL